MKRLFLCTSIVLAVSLVGGAVPAGADQVAPIGTCDSGYLCVHWDAHERGQKFQFFEQNHSWNHGGACGGGAEHQHCWAINDDDSSSWNRKFSGGDPGTRARIFQNSQQDGWWPAIVCLVPGQYASHHVPTDSGSGNTWPTSCA